VSAFQGKQTKSKLSSEWEQPSEIVAAEYISDILPGMVRVADNAGLDLVAYLLQMACDAAAEESGSSKKRAARSRAADRSKPGKTAKSR
jgi:hypothetical protein